jgi:hypothetical protein
MLILIQHAREKRNILKTCKSDLYTHVQFFQKNIIFNYPKTHFTDALFAMVKKMDPWRARLRVKKKSFWRHGIVTVSSIYQDTFNVIN